MSTSERHQRLLGDSFPLSQLRTYPRWQRLLLATFTVAILASASFPTK